MVKPVSEEHALLCGMVWGMAMKYGVPMVPVMDRDDAEGYDYSDTFELELPRDYGGEGSPTRVYLVVQPPSPAQDHHDRDERQPDRDAEHEAPQDAPHRADSVVVGHAHPPLPPQASVLPEATDG